MDWQNDLDKTLEEISKKYVESKVKDALDVIFKLLNNILKDPKEQKFRIFKKTNEVIKTRVLVMKEFLIFMKNLGYTDLDSDCMIFTEEKDFSKIKKGIEVINNYLKDLNQKIKNQEKLEDLKHHEEIKKHNEDIKRKFQEEKEKQQKILEQLKYDKEERKKMEMREERVQVT